MPASASSTVARLSCGLRNRDGAADATRASDANLCLPTPPLDGASFGVRGYNATLQSSEPIVDDVCMVGCGSGGILVESLISNTGVQLYQTTVPD
jgi:hypothetical protein